MNDKTVLVIDDSSTIRKLVDTHLSPVGYRVILAPNAEEGLQLAKEVKPDLILLDHQLPGTTGYEVASKLAEIPEHQHIPVVISSTLRKKAYAEYIDLDNVVDMLPKPYTEELLRTTVANAIETAAMIVASQTDGTAVPEVIQATGESALEGSLDCFGLRELIDFLNNGRKAGVLEIEAGQARVRFHLERGRIQGVYASGIDPQDTEAMIGRLPASLTNLAPVLKMTIGGRSCAEVDGFVQLLDQRVLDPRLMTKLLRFQAAMLVRMAFARQHSTFRFDAGHSENTLHKNLPLDLSLIALLVEGAIHEGDSDQDPNENVVFVRRAIRGQNLDRAGLSARHMKLLNALTDPRSSQQVAESLGWELDEVQQVLNGFVLADLVEQREQTIAGQFVVFEPDPEQARSLRNALDASDHRYVGKVVRDRLALQLILKRSIPHTLIFAGDDDETCAMIGKLFSTNDPRASAVRRIALVGTGSSAQSIDWNDRVGFVPNEIICRPCTAELIFRACDRVLSNTTGSDVSTEPTSADTTLEENKREPLVSTLPQIDIHAPESVSIGAES